MPVSKTGIAVKLIALFFAAGFAVTFWEMRVRKKIGILALSFLIPMGLSGSVAAYAYFIEPNWIQVSRVKIHDPELAAVLGKTRIVHITDIHLTHGIGFREKQMIWKVNALKPDIIFFTGDLFDDPAQINSALRIFRAMKANLAVIGIPGDTDLIVVNSAAFEKTLTPVMHVMNNKAAQLTLKNGKNLWVAGLDRPSPDKLRYVLGGIPPGQPLILLSPSPDIFDEAARQDVNLILTGDTHGGQVGIDFLIKLSEYANRGPYMRGLFKRGKSQMYVNRGIGTKTRPIRFLCPPEIALIEAAA